MLGDPPAVFLYLFGIINYLDTKTTKRDQFAERWVFSFLFFFPRVAMEIFKTQRRRRMKYIAKFFLVVFGIRERKIEKTDRNLWRSKRDLHSFSCDDQLDAIKNLSLRWPWLLLFAERWGREGGFHGTSSSDCDLKVTLKILRENLLSTPETVCLGALSLTCVMFDAFFSFGSYKLYGISYRVKILLQE